MNIKEKWVSWEEFNQLFPGLSPTSTFDFSRVGGLLPGSIPFGDAAGMLTEYNSVFFFDEANVRWGFGTDTPDVTIDIEFDSVATVVSRVSAKTRPWRHWECVDGNWGLAIGIDADDGIISFNYDTPIGTIDTNMMVFDGPNQRVGILDATPAYPFDVGGNTRIQGTFRTTGAVVLETTLGVTGTATFNGLLTNTAGAKLEIQGEVDGGSTRGIFLWDITSTNWGIYMSQSGAGKSLADGIACTNFAGDTGHHFRFRIADIAGRAFVWENSSETCLMDLEGDTGNLSIAGIFNITKATALLIDLYPGFTGSGHVVDITPSAVIDTVDAVWQGIYIDCTALDPSAIGVEIHGMHIDLSGVDKTFNPHTDCLHLLSPTMLGGDHALHADGEVHIDIDATSGAAGEEYTAIDVIIATVGSTGGDLHVLDVARSGAGAIGIAAIGTHEGIDVLHQAIGTFGAADKIWEYDNDGPGWTDVTAGVVNIWDDKDDLIYVGHSATFSEIKFIFSVVATKNMHFKFYFSEGGAVWTQFFPADDTEGATQNGSVRYTASALAAWATDTVNGTANKYWIKIERTRTSGTGPTATSMQQLAPTLYGWDKLGVITALSLSVGQVTDTGVTATNVAAGTTGQRPAGTVGDIRFNSTLGNFEVYTGAWENLVAGAGDVTAAAVLADHTIIRGDGGAKGVQDTGINIDDNDNITLPDGASFNLQEDITFLGATTENQIKIPDHLADAFSFKEGANFYMTFITTNGSEAIQFHKTIFINDTANAKMTIGLTINQGANDDEIVAFKSSDVNQGCTAIAELDTYGAMRKIHATNGGFEFWGFTSGEPAQRFIGVATADNTDKDATAESPVEVLAYKIVGITVGAQGADANSFVVKSGGNAVFIVDEDGDVWADGAYENFQDHNDIKLLAELEDVLSDKISRKVMKGKDVYKKHGVVNVSEGITEEGKPFFSRFVSTKKKNMLIYGAIRQLNEKIIQLESQLNN